MYLTTPTPTLSVLRYLTTLQILLFPQGVELAVEASTKASSDVGIKLPQTDLYRPLAATKDLHRRGLC